MRSLGSQCWPGRDLTLRACYVLLPNRRGRSALIPLQNCVVELGKEESLPAPIPASEQWDLCLFACFEDGPGSRL